MTYVISDIHGEYKKLINMLEQIEFNDSDTLYVLGDAIDRGPEPIRCLQYIMNHSNMKMLIGNHEDMMVKSVDENMNDYFYCWMSNGGDKTLRQFKKLTPLKQLEMIDYIKALPTYFVLDKHVMVHAGVDVGVPLKDIKQFVSDQDTETLIWLRPEFSKMKIDGYTIIFGHTPTYYMERIHPMKIWHSQGKIGIDCGSCFDGGQLGCLRLDDMREFYC